MPYKDREKQNKYVREWIAARRTAWFADKTCGECGSTEDLQLDHVDPKKKTSHRIWSWSEKRREAELAKCRPLCRLCHDRKSSGEHQRGVERPNSRLTDDDVRVIRISSESCRMLGKKYNVSFKTISQVKRRIDWKHID